MNEKKEEHQMQTEKLFMRVEEVAEVMEVSVAYAYKIIRQMNEELKKTGCITLQGRIDRKFFYEHFYSSRDQRGLAMWDAIKTLPMGRGIRSFAIPIGRESAGKNANAVLPRSGRPKLGSRSF